MSQTLLIGKAKELYVATLLFAENLHVYFPLVDNGFDLLVTSKDGSRFLPVQVKYKASRTGFSLDREDVNKFVHAKAVLAFGSGEASLDNFYFFPAEEWAKRAVDNSRQDNKLVAYLSREREWAEQHKGKVGIDKCFELVTKIA